MATQILAGTRTEQPAGQFPVLLKFSPLIELSDEQFFTLCAQNDDVRIERTAGGQLEVMPPAGMYSGSRNSDITSQLGVWARRDGSGVAFDSSTGFTLPSGAVRAPDAAWIPKSRLAELTPGDKEGFGSICPDFVIELRSGADSLRRLRAKMDEYMENGARLGWLVDPLEERVYVYRPGSDVAVLDKPEAISAEPELDGFTLMLGDVWGLRF